MIIINNKVLVKLIVPEVDVSFDVYLPVNRKVGNIINMLNKMVSEFTNGEFLISNTNSLYNVMTKEEYLPDILLVNTTIRNGTRLVLLS